MQEEPDLVQIVKKAQELARQLVQDVPPFEEPLEQRLSLLTQLIDTTTQVSNALADGNPDLPFRRR